MTGWRGINHSYALINQYQLLELLKRDDLRLFHHDAPFARAGWSRASNPAGLPATDQAAIDAIPPPRGATVDYAYTITSPYLPPTRTARVRAVHFMITETGLIRSAFASETVNVAAYTEGADLIQTSSAWSRDRLADWGFNADKIAVIPLGVDAETFAPMSENDRTMSRTTLAVRPDQALFFAVSAAYFNKGLDLVLRGFATLVHKGRDVRLIVKDQKDIYGLAAEDVIQNLAPRYPGLFTEDVVARMSFVHGNVPKAILRLLYCSADCLVSAYRAEGFNLPVLEAISCATPVIVTHGGATDEFVSPDVAMRVHGRFKPLEDKATGLLGAVIEPDFDALVDAMDLVATQRAGKGRNVDAYRAIAARFDWPSATSRLVDLLKDGIVPPSAPADASSE